MDTVSADPEGEQPPPLALGVSLKTAMDFAAEWLAKRSFLVRLTDGSILTSRRFPATVSTMPHQREAFITVELQHFPDSDTEWSSTAFPREVALIVVLKPLPGDRCSAGVFCTMPELEDEVAKLGLVLGNLFPDAGQRRAERMDTVPDTPETAGSFSSQWTWLDSTARTPAGEPVAPQSDDEWVNYWVQFCACKNCGAPLPGHNERRFDPEREWERCDFCDDRARKAFIEQQQDARRWQGGAVEEPPAPGRRGKRSKFPPATKTAMKCKARTQKARGYTLEQIAAGFEHAISASQLCRWLKERD